METMQKSLKSSSKTYKKIAYLMLFALLTLAGCLNSGTNGGAQKLAGPGKIDSIAKPESYYLNATVDGKQFTGAWFGGAGQYGKIQLGSGTGSPQTVFSGPDTSESVITVNFSKYAKLNIQVPIHGDSVTLTYTPKSVVDVYRTDTHTDAKGGGYFTLTQFNPRDTSYTGKFNGQLIDNQGKKVIIENGSFHMRAYGLTSKQK